MRSGAVRDALPKSRRAPSTPAIERCGQIPFREGVAVLFRTYLTLLLFLSACATTEPLASTPRVANLQRAAALPWADNGQCVVQEASNEWPVLVERCYQALDHERIQFRDPTGRCAVASAGAAALGLGMCILVAPEIVVGAVIITGAVVIAAAIKEELDAYERSASRDLARPEHPTRPSHQQDFSASRKRKPEPFISLIPSPEDREDWNEQCRDHYVRCKHSPEGERWGRKFSESQCQSCWDLCRRTGQWPDEANDKPCPGA